MRQNPLAAGLAFLFGVIGVAAVLTALVLPKSHVHAVKVHATVVPNVAAACSRDEGVRLSFRWRDRLVQSRTGLVRCADHPAGDRVVVYVASNDRTDVELKSSAITDPATVDPFAVFGPNDLNGLVGVFGAALLLGGAFLYFFECRSRISR